jgi:hypothetical protein
MRCDDFHELIKKNAVESNVDMNAYLWCFHSDEEGQNIGGLILQTTLSKGNKNTGNA